MIAVHAPSTANRGTGRGAVISLRPAVAPACPPGAEVAMLARVLGAAGVRQVRFECADLHGISRGKVVPLAQFPRAAREGLGFPGGLFRQDSHTNSAPPRPGGPLPELAGRHDLLLRPDLATLAVLPWAPGVARVLCTAVYPDGAPSPQEPRGVLRRLLADLARLGYGWCAGFEYEFWVLDRASRAPAFGDRQHGATLRARFHPAFVDALLDGLPALGIQPAAFHAEYAPGQLELTCDPAEGLAAADAAFGFKGAAKELAQAHGLLASFMTKPFADEAAAGGHVHQSVTAPGRGRAMPGDAGPDGGGRASGGGLAAPARRFLAGQLAHAPALTALLAPTLNCYRRFRPHCYAPTHVCWGRDNRSCAIRVVGAGPGGRLECRLGGAAANPYLAAAGLVAAGILGLVEDPPLPPPVAGDASEAAGLSPLPATLEQALRALEADEALCALLGAPLVEGFLAAKRHELDRARRAIADDGAAAPEARVDPWEWDEYAEFL